MSRFRMPITLFTSGLITLALYLLMHGLISNHQAPVGPEEPFFSIRFGPVEIPIETTQPKPPKPKEFKPPNPPPETPELQVETPEIDVALDIDIKLPDLPFPGANFGLPGRPHGGEPAQEGGVVPLVLIRPQYPREAAVKGQQGWGQVVFTITPLGTVKDARVIKAEPPRVFDKEALRAVMRWKFKPRVVGGTAVTHEATQTIQFSLDDG